MSIISSILTSNSKIIRNVWQISKQNDCLKFNRVLPTTTVCLDQKRFAFLNAKTRKRRKTHPFFWWPTVKRRPDVPYKNYLTKDNKEFVDTYIKEEYQTKSPLRAEQLNREEYSPGSMRCGLIAKKLGTYPMWTKSGKRLLTTALQVVDNHVIKYHSPEEWQQNCRPFHQNEKYNKYGVCIVGAESADPRNFTAIYRGLFNESGVMPKNKLTRFFVTPNARLTPGTPLMVTHFRVGDSVDIWGKTRDHGFQGVIKRWNFKGQDKYKATKASRRPGTIGRGRKVMGPWKGHKMAGHMGCERRVLRGLKIWRINTKYNVIWVHGPAVPGECHNWVYIYDTFSSEKRFSDDNPPPFPTSYAEDIKEPLPEEICDKELHAFDEPTIIYEETEAERKAALSAAKAVKKAKTAKIR